MQSSFYAMVLTGELAGRHLALPLGELRIGGADSDVALALEHGQTACLTVGEDGIRLSAPEHCWIDGVHTAPAPEPLPLATPIDIGGIGIAFATTETPHAELAALRLPRRRSALRTWMAASACACAMFAGAIALGGTWLVATASAPAPDAQKHAWLAQQIPALAAKGIKLEIDPTGVATIDGHCNDSESLDALWQGLRQHGIAYHDKLLCGDKIVEKVRQTLQLYGYNDAVVSLDGANDRVKISGSITDDDHWRIVSDRLAEMPGLQNWSVADTTAEYLQSLITGVRDAGLTGHLSVTRSQGVLLVSGILNPLEYRALNEVLSSYAADHPQAPRVVFQNIQGSYDQKNFFPSPVVSVAGNNKAPYLQLEDGTRLSIGSRLPNGYEIVGLEHGGVDLLANDALIHLPLSL
jgi:type III secretion protein D